VKPRKKQMKTPHKHAELIKAWADGAEIESMQWDQRRYGANGAWESDDRPNWNPHRPYRITPTPKLDVVHSVYADESAGVIWFSGNIKNLKLTFDGETGTLKSAAVI
jgi:hypothetical protein